MNAADLLIVPLVGVLAVALHVFSGAAVEWLGNNPGKVAAFLLAVAALFLFIRFAPGVFESARRSACGG